MKLFSGPHFSARVVEESDAEFVFQMRKSAAAKHMHQVSDSIDEQKTYIQRAIDLFHQRKEAYTVAENKKGERCILCRIIVGDAKSGEKPAIHSYIGNEKADPPLILNHWLSTYQIIFDHLQATETAVMTVPRAAKNVDGLYRKIKMCVCVKQDEQYNYYKIKADLYKKRIPFFKKLNLGMSECEGFRRHFL